LAFLRLGLTSFGGPVAHIGYFRDEFVGRRQWLDEDCYASIVALCQFLPGPASSQVGIAIGYERAGAPGALAAWCGFTLPSAIALVAFAFGLNVLTPERTAPWIHGLLIAAVAVVALAVASMAATLAPDARRRTLAIGVACVALLAPASGYAQLALVVAGAIVGRVFLGDVRREASVRAHDARSVENLPRRIDTRVALASGITFAILIVGLPIAERFAHDGPFVAFARFFEVGGLVFGGGHVVLPLLQAQVVTPGWVSDANFLAGYGAAQAVPGPLFTFAAYLGASMQNGPVRGIGGAAICLVAIFLPSFLLLAAVLPYWDRIRRNAEAGAALLGVNAAVVGILLAALYSPVWVTAVRTTSDVALVLAALLALAVWRAPPWTVVLGCAVVTGTFAR
jgi:chromate transporter